MKTDNLYKVASLVHRDIMRVAAVIKSMHFTFQPGQFEEIITQKQSSFGLSATSQQYFSLRTNQPPAISQQYVSLRTNQHQPSATSQKNRLNMFHFDAI
jgi:hypothetical protein